MAHPARQLQMSYAEYVAAERAANVKHEFISGEIWAMSGGTVLHGLLVARVGEAFAKSLGRSPCRRFSSELRIYVPEYGEGLYPDASIVCGKVEQHPADPNGVTNPSVVAEVLSISTGAWDRGGKFERYKSLPSLRDYVLVSQDQNRVEHYARNDDGSWTYRDLRDGDTLRLTGAPAEVAIAELYEDVEDLRELGVD